MKQRLKRETPLSSIHMPHWELVLDEIFHIAPRWISQQSPPKTVGDILDRCSLSAEKTLNRLERVVMTASNIEISCEELEQQIASQMPVLLIDVRQPEEFEICKLDGSLLLCDVDHNVVISQLERGAPAITICHHGVRSFSAAMYFRERGFEQVQSLAGGLDRWAQVIDPTMERY